MHKIYIPLFSKTLHNKQISLCRGNPGIGGSQFTAIRMAILLAKAYPYWKIFLVNQSEIFIENQSENLVQEVYPDESTFFESINPDNFTLIIALTSVLKKVSVKILCKHENNIICWCRHPFDEGTRGLASKVSFKSIVCVGTYQFYSNTYIGKNIFYIQNPFIFPILTKPEKPVKNLKERVSVVYMGALIPGKGFLEVAKSWQFLKILVPGVKLHVIGSTATYGTEPESNLIPARLSFAEKILKFIPEEDIHNGEVVFYGNLGEEKFTIIQNCDVAILNPTGASEAFPASPLECMACGIPVVASDDYGMSDCMRFFPELVVDGHKDIARRVAWVISDPLRYKELQQRSIAVAKWFDSQTDQAITRWIRLISSITSKSPEKIELLPIMPFYGSRIKLIYRQRIRPYMDILKSIVRR